MLIKGADDRAEDIAELNTLLAEAKLTTTQKKRIQEEIRNLEKGAWGEQQAAYYLDFYFAGYKNTIILHDLRLELSNGKTAQIDHLIINRRLDIYVLESKNWNQLSVDETGACTTWRGRIIGVESPLEQCKRHADVLVRAFQLDPQLDAIARGHNIFCRVLVAPDCHLKAPHHQEWFVKADAFHSAWEKEIENESVAKTLLAVARMFRVSREKLIEMGQRLVELHNPGRRDWQARFGLPTAPVAQQPPMNKIVASIPGLANFVPNWGEDWFVLKGRPTEETKKAIKTAGYRPNQEKNGDWVWRLKERRS
jgi:hypothetical protein